MTKPKTLNTHQLHGRITGDVTTEELGSGDVLTIFSLMYFTTGHTDKGGSHANFIKIEAFNEISEMVRPHLRNGLEVIVSGELLHNRWVDDNHNPKSTYVINANNIVITDKDYCQDRDSD